MSKTFEHLKAWQSSIELAKSIYSITKSFPKEETFGLTAQMRRAVISISSNIAEGSSRDSKKSFIQFIRISIGSLNELESQLIISFKLGFINKQKINNIQNEIKTTGELLGGLKRYLCKKQ
jgi:four helix bundle protein